MKTYIERLKEAGKLRNYIRKANGLQWLPSHYGYYRGDPLYEHEKILNNYERMRNQTAWVMAIAIAPMFFFGVVVTIACGIYITQAKLKALTLFCLIVIGILVARKVFLLYRSFESDWESMMESWIKDHWKLAAFFDEVLAIAYIVDTDEMTAAPKLNLLIGTGPETGDLLVPAHVIEACGRFLIKDAKRKILADHEGRENEAAGLGAKLKQYHAMFQPYDIVVRDSDIRSVYADAKKELVADGTIIPWNAPA